MNIIPLLALQPSLSEPFGHLCNLLLCRFKGVKRLCESEAEGHDTKRRCVDVHADAATLGRQPQAAAAASSVAGTHSCQASCNAFYVMHTSC